ncbi:MAG: hypothetical protein DYH13_03170 [Alphaproteobacteria bacterium PRO2]|nr:hypothetical protein [Alphaproteobacteria bacterium PRO2]
MTDSGNSYIRREAELTNTDAWFRENLMSQNRDTLNVVLNVADSFLADNHPKVEKSMLLGFKAAALIRLEKADEAIPYLRESVALDPGHPLLSNFHLTLANVLFNEAFPKYSAGFAVPTERWEEIISCSEKALKLYPYSQKIYYNLGHVYFLMKNFTKAAEYFGKKVELFGHDHTYVDLMNYASALAEIEPGTLSQTETAENLKKSLDLFSKALPIAQMNCDEINVTYIIEVMEKNKRLLREVLDGPADPACN